MNRSKLYGWNDESKQSRVPRYQVGVIHPLLLNAFREALDCNYLHSLGSDVIRFQGNDGCLDMTSLDFVMSIKKEFI